LGLALENFNTVGQYQKFDRDTLSLIDSSGVLPDGTEIKRAEDLTRALVGRSDLFVKSLTEHLMAYAIGRTVDYRDMPLVRQIVRDVAEDGNRFESIVYNIVNSDAFRMRESLTSTDSAGANHQASL